MVSLPTGPSSPLPTALAGLPRLLAYAQSLGLERHLRRAKRGVPSLVAALLWLVLAWRGTGRPSRLEHLDEPLLAALLGRDRLPRAKTLRVALRRFPAKAVRAAVEAAYRAELGRRGAAVWVAVDAHQLPYWGRGEPDRFQQGWSGSHSRRLRGYRLYLAVDTDTGQVVTFLLARGRGRDARFAALLARRCRAVLGDRLAGVVADCGFTSRASVAALLASGVPFILGFARSRPVRERLAALAADELAALGAEGAVALGPSAWDERLSLFALRARTPSDRRGPWVYVTSLTGVPAPVLADTYRRRWRAEQAIEELKNGHDLDHLVAYRLHPNRVAVGFRLLARNLAVGLQIAAAGARPGAIREPASFRAAHVDGLGTFTARARTVALAPLRRAGPAVRLQLPWTRRVVRLAA
jgi:hypothetical protein